MANQPGAIVTNEATEIALVNRAFSLVLVFVLLDLGSIVSQEVASFALEVSHMKMPLPNMRVESSFGFSLELPVTLAARPDAILILGYQVPDLLRDLLVGQTLELVGHPHLLLRRDLLLHVGIVFPLLQLDSLEHARMFLQ